MNPRIIIAGGGTGGHIFPAVAIGQALLRAVPGADLLFVGALGKMEMEKVPQAGFRITGLDICGFNRRSLLSNWSLPVKLLKAVLAARSILKQFKPHCVVGVGGYASFPMLRAAQRAGIPTLIQEQNSYAGKSNKILARRARRICVAYDGMEQFFPAARIVLTGNPVRQAIAKSTLGRPEGQAWLGLDIARKTLLVVGGSLGAKTINETIAFHLPVLLQTENIQLIWQTGKPFYEPALAAAKPYKNRVKVFDFIRDMEFAYAAADVVISRAGALAIAELCIAGKPVVFVPYPFAAEDHQTTNALALVKKDAALMIADKDAETGLMPLLVRLLADNTIQETMARNIKNAAIADADTRIANEVLTLVNACMS